MADMLNHPGVYVNEVNAFPNSVVAVATAIPAFIGYTRRADYQGRTYLLKPVRLRSLQDFLVFFGALDANGNAETDLAQYTPRYTPVASASASGEITLGGRAYDLLPDPGTIYYLYNSIKLFYQNGGGDCFVVSAGLTGNPTGKTLGPTDPLGNPNVRLTDLQNALSVLEQEAEPAMIVAPDALLLPEADYTTFMQSVLTQCGNLGSRVGILDIYRGEHPDPATFMNDIAAFRAAVGMNNLNYGAAYYPFLRTTIVPDAGINFENVGGAKVLSSVLTNAAAEPLKTLLGQMAEVGKAGAPSALRIENDLLQASEDYLQLHNYLLGKINTLPPSAAMAGVFTMVDNTQGVWKAPANVSLNAVVDTTLKISDAMQGPLNVDATTGKSINAIRLFPGFGVMVWGARTLDGNSQDWRYINVRRTIIMIEQSIKLAARAYVFAPNVAATWSLVSSMLNQFLTTLWSQGALVGATPAAAFSVAVGLGVTMTSEDILNGLMNIAVRVAVVHPAEFIVITISQQMQSS